MSRLEGGQISAPFTLKSPPPSFSRLDTAWRYLTLGFTHILPNGLDHMLFVLGIYLLSRQTRSVLLQVSAFTKLKGLARITPQEEQAKWLGPIAELEQKVAAKPLDHQARFDLATALNADGKRSEATAQLLEIVRRDRKWNDDGARKQLVQFFEAWGGADEATVEGRKRLSTILFS